MNSHSPPAEKIALFRSLFRGREDVYPLRFESRKTGRTGYSPACGDEWVRGICEKPRIKCSECSCQAWLVDALVPRHGYFVLRFLGEDAGKRLDEILDAVLAALTHRGLSLRPLKTD